MRPDRTWPVRLNIVSGSVESDFAMFGVEMADHEERYAVTEEWTTVRKRLGESDEPFDFDGRYFRLRGAYSRPGALRDGPADHHQRRSGTERAAPVIPAGARSWPS